VILRGTFAGFLAVLVLAPGHAPAQTILNTERFQLREVEGIHASADLDISIQRGNTRLLNVSTSGMIGTLSGRHWPRVIFGGRYLSDDDRSILDEQFAQVRYSYILSPETRTFHFVQAQKNETLLLQSRWLVGSGLRRTMVDTGRTSIALGTGAMIEWEELEASRIGPDDQASSRAVRMTNLAVFSHDFPGGARVLNILYVQPDLSDPGDLRLLNDLALLIPLSDRFRTTVSLEWRRDSRPPSTLEGDDLNLKVGFGIDWL